MSVCHRSQVAYEPQASAAAEVVLIRQPKCDFIAFRQPQAPMLRA
jgi:hypothetical protein